ncbi:MAG: OmpA family protein [Muribaculaceae bacterium]|nr:OmpA family protein [Muribaculaceae bacterium]
MRYRLIYILILLFCGMFPVSGYGKGQDGADSEAGYFEMSLEDNITTPVVGKKEKAAVISYQKKRAEELLSHGHSVETMRGGEVIVATIGSDNLFAPNDTVLCPGAENLLLPYSGFLKEPGLYKVLIVSHSDNTGSEDYTYRLTESRVNAVYDWFERSGADMSALVPYAMGDSEPLGSNNSRLNRKKNRRLEIYLIPGERMIGMARKNSLH